MTEDRIAAEADVVTKLSRQPVADTVARRACLDSVQPSR